MQRCDHPEVDATGVSPTARTRWRWLANQAFLMGLGGAEAADRETCVFLGADERRNHGARWADNEVQLREVCRKSQAAPKQEQMPMTQRQVVSEIGPERMTL